MRPRTFLLLNFIFSSAVLGFLVWLIYGRGHNGAADPAGYAYLPSLNAALNGTSALFLALALWAVKTGRLILHRNLMISAFSFSALFLICYIFYHAVHGDTRFTGQGWIRPVYFSILISHILLSGLALPMVLLTFFLSLSGRIPWHKKIAPYTWSVWMYVSVTGVAVYFLLRQSH